MKKMAGKPKRNITRNEVEKFDKVRSQMKQLSTDLENLSKKSPDGPLSKFKLGFINEILEKANIFLQDPFTPINGFELFDDATLPSNSDVVMVLSQYLTCLEQWRSANVHLEGEQYSRKWLWNVPGESIVTERPTSAVHDDNDDD